MRKCHISKDVAMSCLMPFQSFLFSCLIKGQKISKVLGQIPQRRLTFSLLSFPYSCVYTGLNKNMFYFFYFLENLKFIHVVYPCDILSNVIFHIIFLLGISYLEFELGVGVAVIVNMILALLAKSCVILLDVFPLAFLKSNPPAPPPSATTKASVSRNATTGFAFLKFRIL